MKQEVQRTEKAVAKSADTQPIRSARNFSRRF
jgi:hypothetical protein